MISAMPAVAVRRERKKQRAAAAAAHSSNGSCSAGSRRGSLSSLPSPSTRSSSLLSTPNPSPMSVPGNYYNYFARHQPNRRPSSVSTAATMPCGPPSRRPSATTTVSTISSAASNYVSALHKVRERQLDLYRERARFLVYTGSVLVASGATLVVIGLVAATTAAQTVGLLFVVLGLSMCCARVFCLVHRETLPLVRRATTVSGASVYSAATTPGDDASTTSSYYFSAVPLQRIPQQQQHSTPATTPLTSPSTIAPPPLRPPPPPPVVVPGVHGGHRSNPSSLLTPMSLDSIPEMQVLITDDSQGY